MNLQDVGSIGELIGALAVLISFLYLARQIRQSSRAVNAATEQSISQAWTMALSIPGQSTQAADISTRGNRAPGELSESELMHYLLMVQIIFNQYENAHLCHLDGTLSERRWARAENGVGLYLSFPGLKLWWEWSGRAAASPEFCAYMEARFATAEAVPSRDGGRVSENPENHTA